MTEGGQTTEQQHISRRQMLAGMGVVTAGMWTAPVIIDSILSPAFAAGSGEIGYFFVIYVLKGVPNVTKYVRFGITGTNTVSCSTGTSDPHGVLTNCDFTLPTAGNCAFFSASYNPAASKGTLTVTLTGSAPTSLSLQTSDGAEGGEFTDNKNSPQCHYTATGVGAGQTATMQAN